MPESLECERVARAQKGFVHTLREQGERPVGRALRDRDDAAGAVCLDPQIDSSDTEWTESHFERHVVRAVTLEDFREVVNLASCRPDRVVKA